jgi:hypothetical protein
MRNERQLTVLVWWVALAWAATLVVGGTMPTLTFFKPVSTVSGVVVLSLAAFDRWLWHWPLLRGWFVKRPDLRGTWEVDLRSEWIDPLTGSQVPPIEAYLVVSQTYSTLGMRLFTLQSESRLRGAEILCNDDDSFDVVAVYQNEPKLEFRLRSPIHQGALKLSVREAPTLTLDGHYWTDRGTQGSIRTVKRILKGSDSFEGAKTSVNSAAARKRLRG